MTGVQVEQGDVRGTLVVVEGYDGSGKSTLIEAVRDAVAPQTVRVVGRKNEPELIAVSRAVEREDIRPSPEVEMLLRIGLEMERRLVVARALRDHDLVICDRAVVSLVAWFDYLGVDRRPFEPLVRQVEEFYRNAVTVVLSADFETCWARSAGRPDPSLKERQGVEANRRFFVQYARLVERHADSGAEIIAIDTVTSDVAGSVSQVMTRLESRGIRR